MKYYMLDKEEQELLDAVERKVFAQVPKAKGELARLRAAARATLNRIKNINIRLSARDLQKLKARAAEKGIPYQTLVASVIHQYTNR